MNLVPVFVGGRTTSHCAAVGLAWLPVVCEKLSSIKYSWSILNDHLSHADGDQYGE